MAESKIVEKDNHLLFEDGRFYVTETPYKDGRQTDFPKKIDVTDDVKKAIMPKTFIDIDKFICSYLSILEKRKEHTKGIEGLKISGRYQLIIDLLKQQGIIYKDGSLIKIGSKKCEGKAEEYIQGICNTGDWLTPGEAREAVRTAREEVIERACEWLNNFYSEDRHCFLVKEDIEAFKQAMEKGE